MATNIRFLRPFSYSPPYFNSEEVEIAICCSLFIEFLQIDGGGRALRSEPDSNNQNVTWKVLFFSPSRWQEIPKTQTSLESPNPSAWQRSNPCFPPRLIRQGHPR